MNVVTDATPWHVKRIVYEIDEMGAMSPATCHSYSHRPGRPARLCVYRPDDSSRSPKRGIVFVHGGPVPLDYAAPTNWGQYISWGQLIAASGSVGFTFDHSYTDFKRLEDAAQDVQAAVSFIRAHAVEFGIDPDRICLWACSGGGPLLSWALRNQPDYIQCIVIYYAYLDLRQKPELANILSKDAVEEFSPAVWISKQRAADLPILIAKAGQDDVVLNQSIDSFVIQARSAGLAVETLIHETGQHGFDVSDDDSTSRSIIARTIEFINQNT